LRKRFILPVALMLPLMLEACETYTAPTSEQLAGEGYIDLGLGAFSDAEKIPFANNEAAWLIECRDWDQPSCYRRAAAVCVSGYRIAQGEPVPLTQGSYRTTIVVICTEAGTAN
jgi:hypothetical protein